MKAVFEFEDYQRFLEAVLLPTGETRGMRSRLAEKLGCQPAFITRALQGEVHLTPEQGALTCEFLKLSPLETRYFILLLLKARSALRSLSQIYETELQEILRERQKIAKRLATERSLTDTQEMHYYSAWYYAAIHVLASVPGLDTPAALQAHLRMPMPLVHQAIQLLLESGLLISKPGGKLGPGTMRIHLSQDSPMVSRHHANWRLKAMEAADSRNSENLHYSSIWSLSREDRKTVREILMRTLEEIEPLLRKSKEESVICLNFDLFGI